MEAALDENNSWVISIKDKLKEEQNRYNDIKWCVYKVPGWLKDPVCDDNDKTPYVPEIISFGPYHWGESRLAEMESHKWRCFQNILTTEHHHVEDYLKEMRIIEDDVRACYQGPLNDKLDSNAFVKMLVLDGCFMLEFLRVRSIGLMNSKYAENDPVFSKDTLIHVIARDMIKLENQLPVFVLEKLLYIGSTVNKGHVPKLVMRVLTPIWITNEFLDRKQLRTMREAVAANSGNKMLHCLDIFRSTLLYKGASIPEDEEDEVSVRMTNEVAAYPSNKLHDFLNTIRSSLCWYKPSSTSQDDDVATLDQEEPVQPDDQQIEPLSDEENGRGPKSYASWSSSILEQDEKENKKQKRSCLTDVVMVYCVKDLKEAGVKIKKRMNQPFWNLHFDKGHGVLEIPPIKIDDATKAVFLNLIAYEQCHYKKIWNMPITDYVAFMDMLVNSGADVRHLHEAGIIVHQLGSDDEVADLFNRFVKKAFVDWKRGKLHGLYGQLNTYCSHRRHRWRAALINDYLKNPWVIISLCFAMFLFLLAFVQTFFAVFAYFKPPKSG